jgi:hypothetical protein
MILETILIIIAAFIIAALPLHLAVKMLGGRSTILKVIVVQLLVGVVVALIHAFFSFASLIAFLVLIWIYREMFRLKWFKAVLAWIIQGVLTFLGILILGIVFGISLLL